jgi:glycosyltransferase involved in cell wall biosynthesis
MLDADGSTDPSEIPRFIAALCAGADFVKGSRYAQGGGSSDLTPTRRLGNACLNWLVNSLFGTRYTDLCYGYNAFWSRCLPYIRLDVPGFEVETLMAVRVARAGLLIHEVPSYERPRLEGLSNLSAIRDGLRILRCSCTRAMATICRPTRRASRSGASRPGSRPTTMRSRAMWSYLRHHGGDFDLDGQRMLPTLLLTGGGGAPRDLHPAVLRLRPAALAQPGQGRRHRLDHRVAVRRRACALCISKSEGLQVRRYAPNAAVRIVPNGFDAASIAGAEPFRVKRRMILTVDRLTRWAGIHRVISALPAPGPNYAVVVAGNGRGAACSRRTPTTSRSPTRCGSSAR